MIAAEQIAIPSDLYWQSIAGSRRGWKGADATFSIPLPDGRTVWTCTDTLFEIDGPHGSGRNGTSWIENSLLVQDGENVELLHGGAASSPRALFAPASSSSWYWMGDGTVEGDELLLFLLRIQRFGPAMFDWSWAGNELVSLQLSDLTCRTMYPVVSDNRVQYGSAVLETEGYTYVYGVEDLHDRKLAHVARAPHGQLRSRWEFFDGGDWSVFSKDSAPIVAASVSNNFAVTPWNGLFALITMETGRLLLEWGEIVAYFSSTPHGPWENRTLIYTTPEPDGSKIFTYNAHAHPQLSTPGELVVSYSVNSSRFEDLLEHPDLCRPRFIRVTMDDAGKGNSVAGHTGDPIPEEA